MESVPSADLPRDDFHTTTCRYLRLPVVSPLSSTERSLMSKKAVLEAAVYQEREEKLIAASQLFEAGDLSDAPTDKSFVRRLNTVMMRRRKNVETKIPATLSDAINSNGKLAKHAELIVFGNWLFEGHPGMEKKGGQQVNSHRLLQCIVAILAELKARPLIMKNNRPTKARANRKQEITKHDLPRQWKILFGEEVKSSMFGSLLKSTRRILPQYLNHLGTGAAHYAGKPIKTSPELQMVSDSISGILPKTPPVRTDILTEPKLKHPAALLPFEIELRYQSQKHQAEHRNLSGCTTASSRLRYIPTMTSSTSSSGTVRADRENKIVLKPDVCIRRDYKTKALIDRVVILIETSTNTNRIALGNIIANTTTPRPHVADPLSRDRLGNGWGVELPPPYSWKGSERHFAIMIQDPTPDVLKSILKKIANGPGLEDFVGIHLIEVSVDFYPKNHFSPEDSILRREQMVGLLQRHHWVRHSLLLDPEPRKPRDVDARQLYDCENQKFTRKAKTSYLFATLDSHRPVDEIQSDGKISEQAIRERILTTKPGQDLYLNSTLVKGGRNWHLQTSVQHKIGDRRNDKQNSLTVLPNDIRRARVEATLSGREILTERGLSKIEDLGSISFRKLTKELLGFKLAMIEPQQHLFTDAQRQMRTRGVYGIDLRMRALKLAGRKGLRWSGVKIPRKSDREGMALEDWQEMNDVVGKALDELKRRWSGFSS